MFNLLIQKFTESPPTLKEYIQILLLWKSKVCRKRMYTKLRGILLGKRGQREFWYNLSRWHTKNRKIKADQEYDKELWLYINNLVFYYNTVSLSNYISQDRCVSKTIFVKNFPPSELVVSLVFLKQQHHILWPEQLFNIRQNLENYCNLLHLKWYSCHTWNTIVYFISIYTNLSLEKQ